MAEQERWMRGSVGWQWWGTLLTQWNNREALHALPDSLILQTPCLDQREALVPRTLGLDILWDPGDQSRRKRPKDATYYSGT